MTTKLKNVIEKIHKGVGRRLEIYNNINCGGCGTFAYFFIKQCEKYGVSANIVYFDRSFEKLPPEVRISNIVNCKKNSYSNVSAYHVMVIIGKTLVDAKYIGTRTPSGITHLEKTEIKVPAKFLGRTLKVRGQWNTDYSQEEYNPIVRRIVNNAFKKEYGAVVTK